VPTYDPQQVFLTFANNRIVGYAAGTFIKASRNEDGYMLTIGADGSGARVKNANHSGRFEITLLASSPANDVLAALAITDELGGVGFGSAFLKDGSGTMLASAQSAWIVKHADAERGKELSEVSWVIETDVLFLQQGGTTLPPA